MSLEATKNPRDIILKPVVTEKSSLSQDEGKYTFEVDPRANKTEIKTQLRHFRAGLDQFERLVDDGDPGALRNHIRAASDLRAQWSPARSADSAV